MKAGIAYVPEDRQMHGLILGMGIKENITLTVLLKFVKFGLINNDKEGLFASDIARQLEIKTAGLWQRAQELSGGNQQKAVLAKWLGTEPKIFILDEPTRGIDVGTKAAVHQLMGDLAEQGVAILMISSELPEIIGMSDRILVMCEGNLTGEFSRAEATQEKIMKAATQRSATL
jgi:rhamnose transport system ATP-binding protein